MKNHFSILEEKIQSWVQIKRTIALWRLRDDQIVCTNGCFDLLHFGHLQYLAAARDLGNRLIVCLNSAESVRRLKGPTRPIQDEKTRTFQLAALSFVDAVVVFEADNPLELIELIAPDFLVKGGDWSPDQIIGSDFVLKNGGQVRSLPFVAGYSTSLIEQRILAGGVV